MQLHLVHWNSQKFSSFSEAVSQDKGLAVVAVFLEVGPKHHSEFDKITKLMKDIQYKGESVVVREPIDLHNFLPLCKTSFPSLLSLSHAWIRDFFPCFFSDLFFFLLLFFCRPIFLVSVRCSVRSDRRGDHH